MGPLFAGSLHLHAERFPTQGTYIMSTQLVWQLINKHNSFKVKNRTGKRTILSSEPGNLYNKHSYKHSGEKTIFFLEHDLVVYLCYSRADACEVLAEGCL